MAANPNKSGHKKGRQNNYALALIGAGLLVIGSVAAAILINLNQRESSTGAGSNEYTVTPSKVNYPAPELTLNDIDGNPISLTDHRGSVVLVNNWATWCPPCKAEMPTLQAYFSAHSAEGFTLLAIEAGDPLPEIVEFAESYQLTFTILIDPNNLALRAFGNDNLPSSYVIDRQGIVRLAWTGPINLKMLEKYVSPLLEE